MQGASARCVILSSAEVNATICFEDVEFDLNGSEVNATISNDDVYNASFEETTTSTTTTTITTAAPAKTGGRSPPIAEPPEEVPFIITPRTIDTEKGDIPARAITDQNCLEYSIINRFTNKEIYITFYLRGYDYVLGSGAIVNSLDMIVVGLESNVIMPNNKTTLMICGKRRVDAEQSYMAFVEINSGEHTEIIDVEIREIKSPMTVSLIGFLNEKILDTPLFTFRIWMIFFIISIVIVYIKYTKKWERKNESGTTP